MRALSPFFFSEVVGADVSVGAEQKKAKSNNSFSFLFTMKIKRLGSHQEREEPQKQT